MKRQIVIWGTGKRAEEAYTFLENHKLFQVVAFGDNNPEKVGGKKFELPIIGSKDIVNISNISYVVISSSAYKEIHVQLQRFLSIPILDSIDELIYTRISIDISGFCNAKCAWCVTGRENRQCPVDPSAYMSLEKFAELYHHLIETNIIVKNTEIMLYSWGEPLLNKDYIEIIEFLAQNHQKYSVSTNASVVQLTEKKYSYECCCGFTISMPGFSQNSYDRIHGFQFEKIKNNIVQIVNNVKQSGYHGEIDLSYHVYKFNQNEIVNAKEFAESLEIRFNPYYPYFNGNSMTEAYLENRLSGSMKEEAEEQLFLNHVKGLISNRPEGYRCFLGNIISIDHNGELVLCCASDSQVHDYYWGNIMDIYSLEELKRKRKKMLLCESCDKCRKLGIDYWMGNNPSYEME